MFAEWLQVRSFRELSHSVISHYYWGAGTSSGGVGVPKHVRVSRSSFPPLHSIIGRMLLSILQRSTEHIFIRPPACSPRVCSDQTPCCARQLLLANGGELDDRAWQQYVDRLRTRKTGPLRREDMLLCFAKRLDYDTVESGRDTLDSDSSVNTMQTDKRLTRD